MTYEKFKPFLDIALEKIATLTPASFGKFTSPRLEDDYIYQKWIGKKKDFTDVYLNLDPTHQELFVQYCGIPEEMAWEYASHLSRFFLFANNYDSSDFGENPFAHPKNGPYLRKLATGKENPQGIHAMEVLKAYRATHNDEWKYYMLRCALGVKQTQPVEK